MGQECAVRPEVLDFQQKVLALEARLAQLGERIRRQRQRGRVRVVQAIVAMA